ncbi:GNAT family N-acetyltransferase [Pokkaliibacter plantistimulans]|uniref:L-ornithine N(alpha)-acyltransferase n=1 Tax=Proteobacteria bacterium 228 TaxID=2083153 RepID=A0A2S5KMA9_9PROT|nr:lysophospholipid acyltransferase family protein [Pokkaliibacter plantistimulans]PPC75669.1 GNAT family N-acetyltransferase [Pokkaliibacter plantistimulans]
MLNIEQVITNKYPAFQQRAPLVRHSTLSLLRGLIHENEINRFLDQYQGLQGFEFLDKVLEYFNFSYRISHQDRSNIPATGRVVIVSNHPLGSLDGLALLQMVGSVRRDVRIVANDLLGHLTPLQSLFLPIDNMANQGHKRSIQRIVQSLMRDEAVIVFPAGEVSRASFTGIKDGKWQSGFLLFARKANAPILPVHVQGKNSMLFYGLSMAYKPFSTLMLANEMFKQRNKVLSVKVGKPIPFQQIDQLPVNNNTKAKMLKKHIYRLGRNGKPLFVTENTIAHPQDRQALKKELVEAECLGSTQDGKRIYLFSYRPDSIVMKEIGRLRELAFRQVGEGTGQRLDVDKYDRYYRHLILWDEEALEIAGAYRLGEVARIAEQGQEIYSAELFRYRPDMQPFFEQGIELGRSFVQPRYWGRRSLDYLWQGIGAYLKCHPEIRYLFGPVSLSNSYPAAAKYLLVTFYRLYFPDRDHLAIANAPFVIPEADQRLLDTVFVGNDYDTDFAELKERLAHYGVTVPTLYKQYSEVCEPGGVRFLDFGVDPDFGYCVDGLVLVDLHRLTVKKRERYLG